jgi:glycosyltransferase involved in cell wall biosynthesis
VPSWKIAYVSSYPPRECGIAQFTKDLVDAGAIVRSLAHPTIVAINDLGSTYNYGDEVRFQIDEQDLETYVGAARYLNHSDVNLVNLQHEFGLFGGDWGEYILALARALEKPLVTTLHTVVPGPPEKAESIVAQLAQLSDKVVVLAKAAVETLEEDYGVPKGKIVVIRHGVPDVPQVPSLTSKRLLGLQGCTVLMSFGLLSPGKGIEFAIRALPAIVDRHPNVMYLIVGETHPEVRKREGEGYRMQLMSLVKELGLSNHVRFHNRFLPRRVLIHYVQAADICVLPHLGEHQASSGTLSYSLACGRAIVSTPFTHAREVLAKGRGLFCKFRDPASIADAVNAILSDEVLRHDLERRAYEFGQRTTWKKVAGQYADLFTELLKSRPRIPVVMPPMSLSHLRGLTDQTGILQHTKYSVPDRREGYTTDDNARALVVVLQLPGVSKKPSLMKLTETYLSFLVQVQRPDGSFHNFMGFDQRPRDETGSPDSTGRALWGCGVAVSSDTPPGFRSIAKEMFDRGLPHIFSTPHLRAKAYAILGLCRYAKAYPKDTNVPANARALSNSLCAAYEANSSDTWKWFEPVITYANPRLPQSLLLSYVMTGERRFLRTAEEALDFLIDVETTKGIFMPVGNTGWYAKGGEKSLYDQQPIEASCMVEAAATAFRITRSEKYLDAARNAFSWFTGRNVRGVRLYDPASGACYDGITPQGVNLNQGAESTISYLLARLAMQKL